MKLLEGNSNRRGFAVLIMLILLGLMVMTMMANSRALHHLDQQIRLVDQQQQKRVAGSTNNIASPPQK